MLKFFLEEEFLKDSTANRLASGDFQKEQKLRNIQNSVIFEAGISEKDIKKYRKKGYKVVLQLF